MVGRLPHSRLVLNGFLIAVSRQNFGTGRLWLVATDDYYPLVLPSA